MAMKYINILFLLIFTGVSNAEEMILRSHQDDRCRGKPWSIQNDDVLRVQISRRYDPGVNQKDIMALAEKMPKDKRDKFLENVKPKPEVDATSFDVVLTNRATALLEKYTRNKVGCKLDFIIDGKVASSATITGFITNGYFRAGSDLSIEEVRELHPKSTDRLFYKEQSLHQNN